MNIDKTKAGIQKGRLYAGPIPPGAHIVGTVSRRIGDTGALCELANGRRVQLNAGAIRSLPTMKERG
jgi:hypothetical protein